MQQTRDIIGLKSSEGQFTRYTKMMVLKLLVCEMKGFDIF